MEAMAAAATEQEGASLQGSESNNKVVDLALAEEEEEDEEEAETNNDSEVEVCNDKHSLTGPRLHGEQEDLVQQENHGQAALAAQPRQEEEEEGHDGGQANNGRPQRREEEEEEEEVPQERGRAPPQLDFWAQERPLPAPDVAAAAAAAQARAQLLPQRPLNDFHYQNSFWYQDWNRFYWPAPAAHLVPPPQPRPHVMLQHQAGPHWQEQEQQQQRQHQGGLVQGVQGQGIVPETCPCVAHFIRHQQRQFNQQYALNCACHPML